MSPKASAAKPPVTGGCQCGAVRYEISMAPVGVHLCHCRMCQRAVGNLFAALAPVKREALRWLDEEPAEFASSTVARRGFCRHCGTPISFAYNESKWLCVTIGSLDHPELAEPTLEYGIESRLPYLRVHPGCEQQTTGGPHVQGMIRQQFEPELELD